MGPVGTTPNPSPSVINPVQTGLTRTPPRQPGRNAGGSITMNGQTTNYAPSAYDPSSTRPNSGGTISKGGLNYVVPPSPAGSYAPASVAQPGAQPARPTPPPPPPQTEAVNPLTNSGSAPKSQLAGTTEDIDPAQAMGFSQRGGGVPAGTDAAPDEDGHTGGTGLYARKFNNPKSASLYDKYVRQLFGSGDDDGA